MYVSLRSKQRLDVSHRKNFRFPNWEIPVLKFSQFRDNIGEKLGTKLQKLGKFWEVELLLRSQKRDFFGTI